MTEENKQVPSQDNTGCGFIALGIIIVLIVLMFSACTGVFSDDEEEEFNPYTEDYDGDGLGGDSDDHEVLHQMPTMPTEPLDDEEDDY